MKRLILFFAALSLSVALAPAQQNPDHATAEPTAATPYGLPSMPVGPDDLIYVSVYDSPALSRTVRVGSNGAIRLPLLKNEVPVLGMMPSEIETAVSKQLQAEQILVDPQVSVSVVEYKSRPISVVGAVKTPVTFQALPGTTLLDAITRAGGLSELAGSDIIVTRHLVIPNGKSSALSQSVSAKSLLEGKDDSLNLPLTGGEEVRIPEGGKIFVTGNVKMPGAYPMQQSSDTTVLKALAVSQGVLPFTAKTAYIYRKAPSGGVRTEIPVELSQIMARKSPDVAILPDDILYIPDNSRRRATASALDRIAGFGTSTASGVLVYGRR